MLFQSKHQLFKYILISIHIYIYLIKALDTSDITITFQILFSYYNLQASLIEEVQVE